METNNIKVEFTITPKSMNSNPINNGRDTIQPHRKKLFNMIISLTNFSLKYFFLKEESIGTNKKIDAIIAENKKAYVDPIKSVYG